MKNILILIILLLSVNCYSQSTQPNYKYPIQTIYRGDSVVMLTLQQYNSLNKKIEDQQLLFNSTLESKNNNALELDKLINKSNKEKKDLLNIINDKDSIINNYIDSLYIDKLSYNIEKDSLIKYLNDIENWTINAAKNKSFIYLNKSKIEVMNFNSYKYKYNKLNRTFVLSPIKEKKKKGIIPTKWKHKINDIKDRLFDNISDIFINNNSLNISEYPFYYKIKTKNEK